MRKSHAASPHRPGSSSRAGRAASRDEIVAAEACCRNAWERAGRTPWTGPGAMDGKSARREGGKVHQQCMRRRRRQEICGVDVGWAQLAAWGDGARWFPAHSITSREGTWLKDRLKNYGVPGVVPCSPGTETVGGVKCCVCTYSQKGTYSATPQWGVISVTSVISERFRSNI